MARVLAVALLSALTLTATLVGETAATASGTTGTVSDNFARANGGLGPNWTAMTVGGLSISSGIVVGTNANGNSGDIRTAETYTSNQFSTITVTSTPLSGGEWIGTGVRAQNGGKSLYVGIYYWNNASPDLMLFKYVNGTWGQLGSTYASGALAAGTQLSLSAVGSALTFSVNGVARITATSATLTGGAPAIMAYGLSNAGTWSGGNVAATTYEIGGTVAGLTGTVVLTDNGTDSLSVSANGPFTFATALGTGTAYAVAVATNPSGQTCTVANGSGAVATANITNVAVSCTTTPTSPPTSGTSGTTGTVSDNFARANGGLGPNWTAMTVGGLSISSGIVVGTNANGNSGDIRTAETYTSNQFSTITVTSTPLSGGEWIGTGVRAQNGGKSLYVGIYYWNNASPDLMLFKYVNGTWTALGATVCTPLPAGTQLTLTAVGSTLAFKENGVVKVSASDTTLTGGAPAIMAYGLSNAGAWSGGDAGFEVDYLSTNATGIESFDMISANNGYGAQVLRVLQPTHPAAGVAHNFLYVLPVEAGLNDTFGDPMATLEALDAQDKYNLTIIEPTFHFYPWYGNNPNDPNVQYETFMTTELVPWVTKHLATSGTEQNWLLGFSKSGYGAQDLILKHPNLFSAAASWDFPATMSSYTEYTGSAENFGSQANFANNYELTPAFVAAHAAPFQTENRLWIGGYNLFATELSEYNATLSAQGIVHTMGPWLLLAHRWDSGWVATALAALYQDSLQPLPPSS